MILADGTLYDTSKQKEILENLESDINQTRNKCSVDIEKVITALDHFGQELADGMFSEYVRNAWLESQIYTASKMLRRNALEYRIRNELGTINFLAKEIKTSAQIQTHLMPLGTLFHIAAGNMDALPA